MLSDILKTQTIKNEKQNTITPCIIHRTATNHYTLQPATKAFMWLAEDSGTKVPNSSLQSTDARGKSSRETFRRESYQGKDSTSNAHGANIQTGKFYGIMDFTTIQEGKSSSHGYLVRPCAAQIYQSESPHCKDLDHALFVAFKYSRQNVLMATT